MKIYIAQTNPCVGDLEGNYQKACDIVKSIKREAKEEETLIVFPELSVIGYPPKDLLEKPAFVELALQYGEKWASLSDDKTAIIFGNISRRPVMVGKSLQNSAYVALNGKVQDIISKCLLPTYDVFDEQRYFQPSTLRDLKKVILFGKKISIVICEDSWSNKEYFKGNYYDTDPLEVHGNSDTELIINISASPFNIDKNFLRIDMLSFLAQKYHKPILYVNQVGGNDDIVFDGSSLYLNTLGLIGFQASGFKEQVACINDNYPYFLLLEPAQIFNALVLGTRDYVQKTGFKKVVIGLSGGVDSALVATIAAFALGPENVLGVGMPSQYSSGGSVDDARALAANLGIGFEIVPIAKIVESYAKSLDPILNPQLPLNDNSISTSGVKLWEENIQARIRGAILMAFSNEQGRLLLTTGNKSEVAMGYCTLYGDTCGGLAVISDVYKTKVYEVCDWINRETYKNGGPPYLIPQNTLTKAPSAELRPNQKDQDSLPPYETLDKILELYVEESLDVEEIFKRYDYFGKELICSVIEKVDKNEYKRRQLAPGLRVTAKAFGTGRQMPIAQKYKHKLEKP